MSTALLALALLIALGITVFLIALGLTGLGTILSRVFPITPFEGALIHLVLFSLTIFLIGLTLLFERIKDSLWTTSVEDGEPLDEMLDVLKHDRNNADADKQLPFRREALKVGRNDPCPCGSGKKYKFCCLNKV